MTGGLSTRYDDNVTYVKENPKGDFITGATVGIGLSQEGKSDTFKMNGNVTQEFFWDNSSFNNNRQDMDLEFQKELSKLDHFQLDDTFLHAEAPRSFEDAFGSANGRYAFYHNKFETEYTRDLSKQFALQTHYGNEFYQADRADLNDSTRNHAGVELDYAHSSALIFLLSYDFSVRDFNPGKNIDARTLITGLRKFFTKQLYLDVKPGVSWLTSTENDQHFVKAVGLVALTDEITESTKAGIFYQRDSGAHASVEDVFNSWRVGCDLSQQLLKRLKGTASLFYGEGDFETSDIEDKFIGVRAELEYEVKENLQTFISYDHLQTDSNRDSRDYKKNVATVGMTLIF